MHENLRQNLCIHSARAYLNAVLRTATVTRYRDAPIRRCVSYISWSVAKLQKFYMT